MDQGVRLLVAFKLSRLNKKDIEHKQNVLTRWKRLTKLVAKS